MDSRQRNGRRRAGASVSGRRNSTATAFTPASAAATTKGARTPQPDTSPPSAGPAMKPMPKAAPSSPNDAARRSGGVTSAMTALAGP